VSASHPFIRFSDQDSPLPEAIALLAGAGLYPQVCAQRMQALGIRLHLLALDEGVDRAFFDDFPFQSRHFIPITRLGKLLTTLRKIQVQYAITAGQIRPRKLFGGLRFDLRAFWLLRQLREKNAATIFAAIADEIERIGVRVLDARSFMEEDLVDEGTRTPSAWKLPLRVLEHGTRIARAIADLDIGQGVVVHNGTVLCVEGFDGTNALLQYAGRFPVKPKLFVKGAKASQDFRFDVPVFGLRTLDHLRSNGIAYAALEAGKTLILHKQEVLVQAEAWGIRLRGYTLAQDAIP
jgi:DUF1009 family protein